MSNSRVLLREPELCPECGRVFLSLYTIRRCEEHIGETVLYKPGKGFTVPPVPPAPLSPSPSVLDISSGSWSSLEETGELRRPPG